MFIPYVFVGEILSEACSAEMEFRKIDPRTSDLLARMALWQGHDLSPLTTWKSDILPDVKSASMDWKRASKVLSSHFAEELRNVKLQRRSRFLLERHSFRNPTSPFVAFTNPDLTGSSLMSQI
jgi:hypothetical protein